MLCQLFDKSITPSPPPKPATPSLFPNNSSPPDALVLRSANAAFNSALSQTEGASPLRNHGHRLSGITEKLFAENAIRRKENSDLRSQIRSRKERTKGKRLVLKDQYAIATEGIQKQLADAQRVTWKGKKRAKLQRARKRKTTPSSKDDDEESTENESDEEGIKVQDRIEVMVR